MVASVSAQFSYAPVLHLGVATVSKTGDARENDANRKYKSQGAFTFAIGGEVRYELSDAFAIHSGLNYQNISSTFERSNNFAKPTNNEGRWSEKYSLNYINLPLLINYHSGKKFYGGAGLNFGFGVGGKYSIDNVTTNSGQLIASKTIEYGGVNTGLVVNAGYKFGCYFVGANAQLGLSSKLKNTFADNSLKTNSLTLSVGYMMGDCCKKKK